MSNAAVPSRNYVDQSFYYAVVIWNLELQGILDVNLSFLNAIDKFDLGSIVVDQHLSNSQNRDVTSYRVSNLPIAETIPEVDRGRSVKYEKVLDC